MELVSVIVPVYKAEKFLNRCIDSILAQTYENFELILIDDGSPDNCGKICDEYAQKDERIKVVHQKNAGASAARNQGIETATGKWIAFVDADDLIQSNYLEYMISEGNNADLIISSNLFIQQKQSILYKRRQDIFKYISLVQYSNGFLWSKLFKRHIIVENGLKMDPHIRFMEDNLFIIDYLLNSQTIQTLCHNFYQLTLEDFIPSEKYNLKINEIIYIVEQYEKRREKLRHINNSDILKFPLILIAMYPLREIMANNDQEYYELYKKYFPKTSKKEFYCNNLISPISRMIGASKVLIKQGDKKQVKMIINYLTHNYINVEYQPLGKFNFLIWHLIKLKLNVLVFILLSIYCKLKHYEKN